MGSGEDPQQTDAQSTTASPLVPLALTAARNYRLDWSVFSVRWHLGKPLRGVTLACDTLTATIVLRVPCSVLGGSCAWPHDALRMQYFVPPGRILRFVTPWLRATRSLILSLDNLKRCD